MQNKLLILTLLAAILISTNLGRVSPSPSVSVEPTPTPKSAARDVPAPTLLTESGADVKSYDIEIIWPPDKAKLSGLNTFSALIRSLKLNDYKMYWQADNGPLVLINDVWAGYPHKEANVDVSSWKWRRDGKYALTFIATDSEGDTITWKSITVFVDITAPARN